jgi:hypothetical protein
VDINSDSKSASSRAVSPYDSDTTEVLEPSELDGAIEENASAVEMDKLPIPAPRTKRKTPAVTPIEFDDDRDMSRPKDLPLLFDSSGKLTLQHPSRKKAVKDLRKQNPPPARLGGLMKKKLSKFLIITK